MRSNCILWALALYRRRKAKGREGYLLIRRSRLGWGPHLLYAEQRASGSLRIVSFKPTAPAAKPCELWFKGRGRWGDYPETRPL